MAMQMVLQVLVVLSFIHEAFTQERSLPKPGCQQTCGNLRIAYPFGIGANCSANQAFRVSCNKSFKPPKAFLDVKNQNLEVLGISIETATIRVNHPVTKICGNISNAQENISSSPFTFSGTENRFIAMGCDNLAIISGRRDDIPGWHDYGACVTFCNITNEYDNCYGACCQLKFPSKSKFISASMRSLDPRPDDKRCRYAFIVDKNWFGNLTYTEDVQSMEHVPAVLDWAPISGCNSFLADNSSTISYVCGRNTGCSDQKCSCFIGYEGNPYLQDGCQDIDECATNNHNCQQICTNTPGGYNCSCTYGWERAGEYNCTLSFKKHHVNEAATVILAAFAVLGVPLVLAFTWLLYKVLKRRKMRKLKEKFLKRNGGLLLHQQINSSEGDVETTKLFTSKELEKATDNYNIDRILGRGGQGTVYKGMLTDGRIVAVKKSKIEDGSKVENFINEVVILSQINHRNVVKLYGCCLETEVPLLVYEFIPNGTLLQYIHDHNKDFPLNWDVRLRVATEVAGALSYLHSAASIPVYHRDIKSTNILLDNKYRAKVADFGTSRTISIDKTHLTTRVQGTFGYFDPEYFQSSQFTDKSDVYSFGVVLVELLTGQKPILAPKPEDGGRSLAAHFTWAKEENRVFDILDPQIKKDGDKKEIIAFANLAYRCLNSKGRNRPTMKEVATELESIRMSHGSPATAQHHHEDVRYPVNEMNGPWDLTSSVI